MDDTENKGYVVELRDDQWELIMLAMQHVRQLTDGTGSGYAIDTIARKFLRRRVTEIETDIRDVVGDLDK